MNATARHSQLISDSLARCAERLPEKHSHAFAQHIAAWRSPRGPEIAIVGLIRAAAEYADSHQQRYESGIGDDGFLGDYWQEILKSIRGLLNGECGRLDCGTLDSLLLAMLHAEGLSEE